ncbi:MAG TPA: SGNH/GDSL hydrolase family protein [Jatrophihabitantaceae bacterium]|jgi:lysophospholipase L1-like esterase|nr:SGNH/GDSL hydrolase family protein [Jatrophihabitantaceae bacterium]
MFPASRSRRIARAAAYGGGGFGAASALIAGALIGVIVGESKLARRRIPQAVTDPPVSHNTSWAAAGVSLNRPPVRLVLLGDSSAAGYGVQRDRDTPGAQLAIAISSIVRRPVHITNVAVVGAQSRQLPAQVAELGRVSPDLAVIMIGTNDVTHRVKPADAVPYLADAVRELRKMGAEVVVGTCADLGTIRALAQPLRRYARHLSRRMARAQIVAVVAAGGRAVSLGDLLGPLFATQHELFSDDQFHPSAAGYAAAAEALLPSALDALGMGTRARSAGAFLTRRPKKVARAAAQAATHPGTEVTGALRQGATNRRRGTWAQLRRRRPRTEVTASPEDAKALPNDAPAVTEATGR